MNLACTYCFADANTSLLKNIASKKIAELFIDRIAEYRANLKIKTRFVIEFTGGEPLTNFEIIRHTVEYAERTYGDLIYADYCVQSNLTLLNDEMIDFFKMYNIGLGMSCDGFKSIHDKNRLFANGKGSHNIVISNIEKLQKNYPNNTGSVIAVITQDSLLNMPEIALYFYLFGFQEIVLRPMEELAEVKQKVELFR